MDPYCLCLKVNYDYLVFLRENELIPYETWSYSEVKLQACLCEYRHLFDNDSLVWFKNIFLSRITSLFL